MTMPLFSSRALGMSQVMAAMILFIVVLSIILISSFLNRIFVKDAEISLSVPKFGLL
jgi:hypothetical protein